MTLAKKSFMVLRMSYDLTLGQAARVLGVAESTLRRWADAGLIPYMRTPGNHRRFTRADLDAFQAKSMSTEAAS